MGFYKPQGGGFQQQGDGQQDNFIVQSSIAQQLFPIIREIMETGNLTDSKQRMHEKSAKLGILFLIKFCARQCDNKVFTSEETAKMEAMTLDDLASELSYWEGEAGMLMSRESPKISKFDQMKPYWAAVRKHRLEYISKDPTKAKNYKIIIIPSNDATPEEIANAEENLSEEFDKNLSDEPVALKPQPSKLDKGEIE
jgi:hypothetical protein